MVDRTSLLIAYRIEVVCRSVRVGHNEKRALVLYECCSTPALALLRPVPAWGTLASARLCTEQRAFPMLFNSAVSLLRVLRRHRPQP